MYLMRNHDVWIYVRCANSDPRIAFDRLYDLIDEAAGHGFLVRGTSFDHCSGNTLKDRIGLRSMLDAVETVSYTHLDVYKRQIFNSFYVSVLCTAVRLLCAAMAAFALTKIPFKGRNAVFGIYVTALMIPSQITFIPLFIIMTNMHLTNSLNAFMLLQLFNAFAIFMMRQKMMTINDAYIEAAVIDLSLIHI